MSLYAIGTEMQGILDAMLEGGVDSHEAMEALDLHLQGLDAALDSKAEDYAGLIQELTMRAEARTKEAQRIRALAQTDAALAERLKQRLKEVMERTGRTRIDTSRFRLSVAQNGGRQSIEIDEGASLPPAYVKTITEPDKDAIRKALEAGETIAGCTLLPRGSSLRIR